MKTLSLTIMIITFMISSINLNSKNSLDPPGNIAARDSLFATFHDFRITLDSLAAIQDSTLRDSLLTAFWDTLVVHEQVPFAIGDSVAFLYKGPAEDVRWDRPHKHSLIPGHRVGDSDIWILEESYPSDMRLDYRIRVDNVFIADPANPNIVILEDAGLVFSVLYMPDFVVPEETIPRPEGPKGTLSDNITTYSENLKYFINHKVYTPAGYDSLDNLPSIYIFDGNLYLFAGIDIVLDNMIADQKIRPVIAVFIDPRDPSNIKINRRENEYYFNDAFANFVTDELVPLIDSSYRTIPSADQRAIMGFSLGGTITVYLGATSYDMFRLIAGQSTYFEKPLHRLYTDGPVFPLKKIVISTGLFWDNLESNRLFKANLEDRCYKKIDYFEINDHHSMGNCIRLFDDVLLFFFGDDTTPSWYDHDVYIMSLQKNANNFPICAVNMCPCIDIQNIGMKNEQNVTVTCHIDTAGVLLYSDSQIVDSLASFELKNTSFKGWKSQINRTYRATFFTELATDADLSNDTLETVVEFTNLVDNFEATLDRWDITGEWSIADDFTRVPEDWVLKNCPQDSFYKNNADCWTACNFSFDLSQQQSAYLKFITMYQTEPDKDFGYVEVSGDGGLTWDVLQSYTGYMGWMPDSLSLNAYCGPGFENVRFRFHFVSDSTQEWGLLGWFIDDIDIYAIGAGTSVTEGKTGQLPIEYALFNNYPNPFNPRTVLSYQLPHKEVVKITVYNLLGQKVKTLVDKQHIAGSYKLAWDGRDQAGRKVPSGIYIYKMEAQGFSATKKMLLLR